MPLGRDFVVTVIAQGPRDIHFFAMIEMMLRFCKFYRSFAVFGHFRRLKFLTIVLPRRSAEISRDSFFVRTTLVAIKAANCKAKTPLPYFFLLCLRPFFAQFISFRIEKRAKSVVFPENLASEIQI